MVSIAEGQEFPQLQKVIEEVNNLFGDAFDLTEIMNDQFNHLCEVERLRRVQLLASKLGADMNILSEKMLDLTEFLFPESIARMARAA